MNRMERTSAAHLVKMTQPEEFDLVILSGGTGSTVDVCWRKQRRCRGRPQVHWRVLPQHCVPAQQEHHPQCFPVSMILAPTVMKIVFESYSGQNNPK